MKKRDNRRHRMTARRKSKTALKVRARAFAADALSAVLSLIAAATVIAYFAV
jgi:hypothetical protein